MWQAADATLLGIIDCKDDISGGRLREERFSAKNSTRNKHFNSIAISPNGEFIIGGGNSKHICLYDMRYKLLMRRFAVTQNRSLDGVLHLLNSKYGLQFDTVLVFPFFNRKTISVININE